MNNPQPRQIPFTDLPEGTVTFLFTDIEGSTQLLHHLRAGYAQVLADHHRLLREAFAAWHGHEVDTQGDSFFVAFSRATEAVGAAAEVQRKLAAHPWPEGAAVRVRMGIHTGEPWSADEGYVGIDIHRAARVAHVAHGGQVLLSETTTALVQDELPGGVSLLDLGRHLLKDIHRPERIHQLIIAGLPCEFPALTSLEVLPSELTRQRRIVGECPYRGLSAFQEADAPFYFGREKFIDALEGAISARKLVAVIVGSSGSGKSSALLAGLLPRLRKAGNYEFAIFRPGLQPFHGLAGVLIPILEPRLNKADVLAETHKLAEHMLKGKVSLSETLERIRADSLAARRVLLVVDQFEELYTLSSDAPLQKLFIDQLLAAGQASRSQPNESAVIILSMRADFMGQALAHRPFADALQEASILMGPMNRAELHAAIGKPAEMQGAAFEPGLVERILDDVGDKPGSLPLLEFTLTQLWARQTDGWLTHADYEAMGCVAGALAVYADQVYAELNEKEQGQTRRALVQLVQPGEGTEDTRRIATRQELGDASWDLIQRLAHARLVVTGQDAQGRQIAEVAHEALIQKWGRFRDWMDADRAFRAWQERMRNGLRQWNESGQDDGALLAGAPLTVAQNWLTERGGELNPSEITFIQASQARQVRLQKERQRRRQWTFAGLATGLVIALGLAALAFYQRQNAQKQAAILLAGQAETELANGNHDRAVLLALSALEDLPYTAQAEAALGKAVTYDQALQQYAEHGSAVTSVDWSPDGSKIASSSTDNTVRIWDPVTGNTSLVIDLPAGISGNVFDQALTVKWSPDGQHLLTLTGDRYLLGSQDFDLATWDAATGQQLKSIEIPNHAAPAAGEGAVTWTEHFPTGAAIAIASRSGRVATLGGDNTAIVWDAAVEARQLTLTGHADAVNAVAWSPDESLLATASEDATARIWNAMNGQAVATLGGHSGPVNAVLWSGDGAKVLTGSDDGTVRVWDPRTGVLLNTIDPKGGVVWSLAWSDAGRNLIVSTGDKLIHLWDVGAEKPGASLGGHIDFVSYLARAPKGDRFASAGQDGIARVWKDSAGTTIAFPYRFLARMAWAPDSRTLVVPYGDAFGATEAPGIAIWDISTGRSTELHTEFKYYPQQTELSPDGRFLYVQGVTSWPEGYVNADPTYIVEVSTGKTVLELNASDGKWIRNGGWSPDGKRIATGSVGGRIDAWDASTGKILWSAVHGQESFVNYVEWSPDGARILSSGTDSVARIWDARTGKEVLDLVGHEPPTEVQSARWSPDGKRILTTAGSADLGAPDNTVRIWDAESGNSDLVIDGHNAAVFLGGWSPDGSRVVTISIDDTMRIWDAKSGAELLNLPAPIEYYGNVMWSPDGKYVALGTDGAGLRLIRVWQSTAELVEYARDCCIFRGLTEAERTQFGLR